MENITFDTSIHSETRDQLREMELVYQSITSYQPAINTPPILDSSVDGHISHDSEHLSGLRPLSEAVKRDIDFIKQFLAGPDATFLPPPSTNAPYLIAVWKEVLSSPPPIIAIGKTFSVYPQNTSRAQGWKSMLAQPESSRAGKRRSTSVKVDVVADNGHSWIRVNTHNSRLLAEFREIDSYLTDSECEDGTDNGPSLARTEFDNSLLRMGRGLLAAAYDNPVLGTPPKVILRLTRIDPVATDGGENDLRIALTIELLREMGLSVELGERGAIMQRLNWVPAVPSPLALMPTHQINLDLSILIALVSDITHASLPKTMDAAYERFIPSASYVNWKRSSFHSKSDRSGDSTNAITRVTNDAVDSTQHSRALAEQLHQEMQKGLLQGFTSDKVLSVQFWTTLEARDRCLRIVDKIGGSAEKRRAHALFPTSPGDDSTSPVEQEAQYWKGSRYPLGFLPLLPIRVFPISESASPVLSQVGFFSALEVTCRTLLAAGGAPHPRAIPPTPESKMTGEDEIQRASVMRTNARLTAHTVQSMLCGAVRGWTTLTANRTSVRTMLREVKTRGSGVEARGRGTGAGNYAAVWIVDPRSLAEVMRSDVSDGPPA
ncbi:hypothetical protein B0F90DRAFT_1631326 [Multifurca ochricompacta]|uniref:DUF1308 domain-containing protein n=1 Tax=Multifurca ochricompacta TaxID=376703 RepID=A0AAD4M294_9AGAM|nr:hypothetical protein B0F90DRAFT_1631326 [Multifurca ochricompacta]